MHICLNYIPHNEITFSNSSLLEVQLPTGFSTNELGFWGDIYLNGLSTNEDGSILYIEFSQLYVEEICIDVVGLTLETGGVVGNLQPIVSITDTNDACENILN